MVGICELEELKIVSSTIVPSIVWDLDNES